jgi:hypothetical protein
MRIYFRYPCSVIPQFSKTRYKFYIGLYHRAVYFSIPTPSIFIPPGQANKQIDKLWIYVAAVRRTPRPSPDIGYRLATA